MQCPKKITKQSHAILEPTQKVSVFYDQCALRSDTPKLVVFNRGDNHLLIVHCSIGKYSVTYGSDVE